jgi:hypothetical protein
MFDKEFKVVRKGYETFINVESAYLDLSNWYFLLAYHALQKGYITKVVEYPNGIKTLAYAKM